jgi:hypothetical protein
VFESLEGLTTDVFIEFINVACAFEEAVLDIAKFPDTRVDVGFNTDVFTLVFSDVVGFLSLDVDLGIIDAVLAEAAKDDSKILEEDDTTDFEYKVSLQSGPVHPTSHIFSPFVELQE